MTAKRVERTVSAEVGTFKAATFTSDGCSIAVRFPADATEGQIDTMMALTMDLPALLMEALMVATAEGEPT